MPGRSRRIVKGIFVTGTDTGVGKTAVAAALVSILRREGFNAGVMKPVETGAKKRGGKLAGEDAEILMKAAGSPDPAELVNPYVFKKPLSPYHAAEAEGARVGVGRIAEAFGELSRKHDIVVVEGAGGLLAPVTAEVSMGRLARRLNIPALIVAHPYLGSINHTLLTARMARFIGLEIAGIVFNQGRRRRFPEPDFDFIAGEAGAPVFGLIPHTSSVENVEKLAAHVRESVDIPALIARLKSLAPKNLQKSYEERDKKYVWHPFTQMKEWMEEPIVVVESGDGVTVRDVQGREFLDLFSSYWCNVHGHGDERINAAVAAQLGRISHSTFLGASNMPAVDLAEKLVEITPDGLDRVFYSDDGSTAVEAALKMSYQYWRQTRAGSGRDMFLAVESAYHGDTMGAMSVGGIDIYHKVFRGLLAKTVFVPPPYCYRCPIGKSYPDCAIACAGLIDEALAANEGRIAAMIIEPLVQCPGGIITAPHGYLKRAAEACARHDVLLIADEVAVGFGRTGRMFACEHEGVRPDIMTLSKSITGGTLPFAATMTTAKVFDAFLGEYRQMKTFFHGHTYTANQLGAAAALENLRLMDERDMIGQAQEKAAELSAVLARLQDLEHVGDVRQRGLIAGVELVADKETKKPYDWTERMGTRVVAEARTRGLLARPLGDILVLFPALSATVAEIRRMTDVLYYSIAAVTE